MPLQQQGVVNHRPIIEDIWRHSNEARILIAELTGRNPNVFYETGIAHTPHPSITRAFPLSRKPHTVIPAQAGIRVGGGARPFCVSQLWKGPAVPHPPLDNPVHSHAILHARTLVQAALPNNMTHSTLTVQHPNHPDPVQQGRDSPKMGQMGQTGGRLNFKTAPESQSWLSFGRGKWGRWGSYLRKRPSTPKVADSPNLIQINSTPDIS